MVASFQSTIDPFIQIFPVPANAMVRKLYGTWGLGLAACYWRSRQNGHASARAGSALPHFQQNFGFSVSRALSRAWMSWTSSEGVAAAAAGAWRQGRRMVAGARAASTASSNSDAR